MANQEKDRQIKDVYHRTTVVRKPISGIVSDYHELPYILVSPDDKDPKYSIKVNGTIKVSPRFVITSDMLGEAFGEVFDPSTFDKDIEARLFSFAYSRRKNVKLENTDFGIATIEEPAREHVDRIHDELLRQENMRTGLIFGPVFKYYPVSLDRFISEILDREFRI